MISPFDIPLGTGMWVPLTVKPWGEPKALISRLSILGEGVPDKEVRTGRQDVLGAAPSQQGVSGERGAGNDRGWVGTGGGGGQLGQASWRPPSPPRRVPPPTAPLKAPVKYGVGGGGTAELQNAPPPLSWWA